MNPRAPAHPRSGAAKALARPRYRQRKVQPKRGRGSYTRKGKELAS